MKALENAEDLVDDSDCTVDLIRKNTRIRSKKETLNMSECIINVVVARYSMATNSRVKDRYIHLSPR